MIPKRVCMKCNSLVKPTAFNASGPTRFECPRHGEIIPRDTRPVGRRYGARKGWHIKTWVKGKKRNVLSKISRRRNR